MTVPFSALIKKRTQKIMICCFINSPDNIIMLEELQPSKTFYFTNNVLLKKSAGLNSGRENSTSDNNKFFCRNTAKGREG